MAASPAPIQGIHHLERDAEFLIELPKSVQVLMVRVSYERGGPA